MRSAFAAEEGRREKDAYTNNNEGQQGVRSALNEGEEVQGVASLVRIMRRKGDVIAIRRNRRRPQLLERRLRR
jgi:hypothetical protein